MNLLEAVPHSWIKASVSKYCDVRLGKMLQNDPSSDRDELKHYLRAINIAKSGLDLSHEFSMWITPSEKDRFRLRNGDILVSEGGDAGRTAVFDSDREYYFQNAINRVRPAATGLIVPEFIYYWFTFLKAAGYVEMVCNVATIPHFTAEKVKAAPLALPPIEMQRRIVRFLDKKTARIDGLIEKKRALLERLAEKRQALITRAVTKGLYPDAPMKPSGTDWLGDIPAHWDVLPLRRLARSVSTGRTPPVAEVDYFAGGEVNWFTPGDFGSGIELTESSRRLIPEALHDGVASLFPSGTVFLVGIGATLGKVAVGTEPGSANQQINAIVLEMENDPYYLAYFLHGFRDEVRVSSNGNTLGILNQSGTKSLPILRPPTAEQNEISVYLRSHDARNADVVQQIENSLMLLRQYRAAIITAAVSGQVADLA